MRTSFAALLLLCAPASAQTDWYVDANGTPPGSGTAADPYTSIQSAIEQAATIDGDTVLVASGTYAETVDFAGKAITVRAQTAQRPVIDALGAGSAVTFASGETGASVLAGFVLTGGTGTDVGGVLHGGGVFVEGATPRLVDLVIEGNQAERGGGLAVLSAGGPSLGQSRIEDNRAERGGGAYVDGSFLSLTRTDVARNVGVISSVPGSGGGLWAGGGARLRVSGGSVDENHIEGFGGGGGLTLADGSATLEGVRFFGNHAGSFIAPGVGGAIAVGDGATLHAVDCTFDSNGITAPGAELDSMRQGGAIMFSGTTGTTASVRDSHFENNAAQLGGAVSQGGVMATVATYTGCSFEGNTGCADGSGLGGAAYGGSFVRCTFRENWACGRGGAAASSVLERCLVVDNFASLTSDGQQPGNGGGVAGGTARRSTFLWNEAKGLGTSLLPSTGGGAFLAELERCVFVGNVAERGAGARLVSEDVTHCTFSGNQARFDSGGLFGGGDVKNSILWANAPDAIGATPNVSWSIVEGGFPGTGNQATDPLLWGPYAGDAHLRPGSPAIDAGDPSDPSDPDGSVPDMGALPFDASHVGQPGVYCSTSPGGGCEPTIGSEGSASLSGPDDFRLLVGALPSQGVAMLLAARSADSSPVAGGTLCLGSPTVRVRTLNVRGTGGCDGQLALEISQTTLGALGLVAGDRLYLQVWFRGPGGSVADTGLTAGVEATILP